MKAPRWLVEGEESTDRVMGFRVVFFALLGLDCWEQISHASRYGAGHFNVSHFPALDGLLPVPEASWVLLSYLLQSFLALSVAGGVAVRRNLALLAILNGLTYFGSQLDSYQHHYLLWLLIVACAGAAWLDPAARGLPAWSLRLMRLQVAVMYIWAALAKLDPSWWSGETLSTQIKAEWALDGVRWAAQAMGQAEISVFAALSIGAILAELLLGAGFLAPKRLGRWVWPLGVAFHVTIQHSGFEIGLFSYFMVALYLLLLPERLLPPLERIWASMTSRWPASQQSPSLAVAAAGALGVGTLAYWVPVTVSPALAAICAGLAFAALRVAAGRSAAHAALQLGAAASLLLFHAGTDQVRDYYRFMGGDARQRAQWDTATFAYTQVVRIDPGYASSWLRLGELHQRAGRLDEAVEAFEAAAEAGAGAESAPALRKLLELQRARGDAEGARETERRLRALPSTGGG